MISCREGWPQTHYVADDELPILLPWPPMYWDYRHAPSYVNFSWSLSKSYMNAFAKHIGGDTE